MCETVWKRIPVTMSVVFDMDGVIFDSERAVMQCWKELADKYQIPDIETGGAFLLRGRR